MPTEVLPASSQWVRSTPEFDQDTVPNGLLRAHQIAAGVWGRLVVRAGALGFTFEDDGVRHVIGSDDEIVIPPLRRHHVSIDGPVVFLVEFYEVR